MCADLFSTFPLGALAARIRELASQEIYIGTSSWKYPGWLNMLYDEQRYLVRKRFSQKRFEDECLTEYAQVFQTVGVDAAYYTFPTEAGLEKLMAAVPDGFQFGLKVTDDITTKRFPTLPRYGMRGGMDNPDFLNAELFIERFLGPCAKFRDKIGPLMFEFSNFKDVDFEPAAFLEQLNGFLSKLPTGWLYAVEIRNAKLIGQEYFTMLRSHQTAHVFNSWSYMPPVVEQLAMPESVTGNCIAARFLLKPGNTYAKAVERFSPYNQTRQVYPEGRQGVRHLIDLNCSNASGSRIPKFIYINNRLEGNALNTILASILGATTE